MSFDPLLTVLGLAALATPTTAVSFAPTAVRAGVNVQAAALPSNPITGDIAMDSGDANKLKWYDGTAWQATGGGSGSPGGSDTEVQFNNGGSFAGDSTFTFASGVVTIGELVTPPKDSGTVTPVAGQIIIDSALSNTLRWYNGFDWLTAITSETSPAGSDTEVQFNSGGFFGADSTFTFASGVVTVGQFVITPSSLPGSPQTGQIVIESDNLNTLAWHNGSEWRYPVQSVNGMTGVDITLSLGDFTAPGNVGDVLYHGSGGVVDAAAYVTYSGGSDVGRITIGTSGPSGSSPELILDGYDAPGFFFPGTFRMTNGGSPRWAITATTQESGDTGHNFTLQASGGAYTDDVLVIEREQFGAAVWYRPTVFSPIALGSVTPAAGMILIDSADGNMLKWYDGSAWNDAGGSGGTPGGSNTYVQFNDSGVFGGIADVRIDKLTSGSNRFSVERVINSPTSGYAGYAAFMDHRVTGSPSGTVHARGMSLNVNNWMSGGTLTGATVLELSLFNLGNAAAITQGSVITATASVRGTIPTLYGFNIGLSNSGVSTVTNAYLLYAAGGTIGGSGTIANLYDLYLGVTGGTTTVTNRWGVYQADTAATNMFAGQVDITRDRIRTTAGSEFGVVNTMTANAATTTGVFYNQRNITNIAGSPGSVYGLDFSISGAGAVDFNVYGIFMQATDINSPAVTGIRMSVGADSSGPTSVVAIDAQAGFSGTGTIGEVTGVKASASVSTSLTATNMYGGLFTLSGSGTATTAYALYADATAGSLTAGTLYGVYQAGATARNYFQGSVEVDSAQAFYIGAPNVDGSWRMIRNGSDLVMARREAGVWVIKQTITP